MKNKKELDVAIWKDISEYSAISGYEHQLHDLLFKHLHPYVDDVFCDGLMSVVGVKKQGELKVLFASHIDEVGFQVKDISEKGYIYLQAIGGLWAHALLAHQFQIETRQGKKIIGVVGCKPPHGMSEKQKSTVLLMDELYLDLGVTNQEEVQKLGVEIGNQVTPYTQFSEMNNHNYLFGKAWDDRCCMAIELELAKRLVDTKSEATIYFAGTAQEEVGQRGARTIAHKINPDISFALDVTNALDTPFENGDIQLGKGPVLTLMDASSIAHEELFKFVEELCLKEAIPFQYSCSKDGGTDNGNIHKSLKGIIGMTISVPCRYMHSSSSIIHKEDMLQTIKLLELICISLTKEVVKKIKQYNQ